LEIPLVERTDLEYYRHRHAQELAQASRAYDNAVAFVHSALADAYARKMLHLSREETHLGREQADAFEVDRRRRRGGRTDRYWSGIPLLRN